MSLLFKPHTVVVTPQVQTPDGSTKVVPVPTDGSTATFTCQITPMRASAAFEATGLDLRNPHLILADPENYTYLKVGNLVTWTAPVRGARRFKVSAPAEVFETSLAGDHAGAVLEELELS